MFFGKAKAYLSGAFFGPSAHRWALGYIGKYYDRLGRPDRDKHTSLIGMFVNYSRKKFYTIVPWPQCYKTFSSVVYEIS
jgi:hypothetical protein